jgi:carboxyl-terminal processing protease
MKIHCTILSVCVLGWSVFIGCAANRWTGSVDAVFRYRPSEASTVVHETKPDTLAAESGLKPGDVLLAVDGVDIEKADFETVRAALRGPVGTNAVLKVRRGDAVLEFTVERRHITANKD